MKTTKNNPALPCPEDKVNREFKAPALNILWVADLTYVRTAVGFVYVAFIIDVFARYIVGCKVSSSPNAQMVLEALDQALAARQCQLGTRSGESTGGRVYPTGARSVRVSRGIRLHPLPRPGRAETAG